MYTAGTRFCTRLYICAIRRQFTVMPVWTRGVQTGVGGSRVHARTAWHQSEAEGHEGSRLPN
jgi:hypothetical protein